MKGMYLGRRFYRQMFGAVLLTPVVMNTALLYPSLPGSFSRFFPLKEGFDFGFWGRWIYPQTSRSYYLSYYL